jgi:competence protein ComEC
MGGALAVLREMEVGELWLGPGGHRHPRIAALMESASRRGAAVLMAERGVSVERGGLLVQVLGPDRADRSLSANDGSIVLRAGQEPARVLIPGDLEAAGEAALRKASVSPEAEALVVGHHGAAAGSSARFLDEVRPRHAVVSCGFGNRYGHPDPGTVRRLRSCGARVWRTDRDGLVMLESSPAGWRVETARRPAELRDGRTRTGPG